MNSTEQQKTILQSVVIERAVLYARVSGDDSRKEGRNLAGQLEMGRDYAHEQGYNVVAELAEDERGASGADIDLPQLNKVREMAHAGQIDVLIVRELDRLSRNLAKQLIVEEELHKAGCRVEYVLAEYDDTPEGRLQKHIRATVAEYEREKIKERMHRGKRRKIESGKVVAANRPPFGYRLNDEGDNFEIRPGEAETVRYIFNLFLQGYTVEGIRAKLSELGIPTPADLRKFHGIKKVAKVGRWGRASVYNILTRETYAGTWHYGKKSYKKYRKVNGKTGYKITKNPKDTWIAVDVPAIISKDAFQFVQDKLAQNSQRRGTPGKGEWLLSKRVVCGECGYSSRVEAHRENGKIKRAYYLCPANRNPDLTRPCSQKAFRQEEVDAAVWAWIVGILSDEHQLEKSLHSEAAQRDKERQPIRNQLDAALAKIAEFEQELESAIPHLKQLKPSSRAYAAVLEDVNRLESAMDKLEAQKRRFEGQLGQKLDSGQIDRIKDIARQVAQGLEQAENSFELRRQVIESLDVEAQLRRDEEGAAYAYVTGYLGTQELELSTSPINGIDQNRGWFVKN